MYSLNKYNNKQDQMQSLAKVVSQQLLDAIQRKDSASLVVPGGTTPAPFFDALSKIDLPWQKVTVFLTDERYVPISSPRSNSKLILDTLMINKASAAQFLPFWIDGLAPEQLSLALAEKIKPYAPFDICVLGMGLDMHTASLFPNMPNLPSMLDDPEKAVIKPVYPACEDEIRLTLTAPSLNSSRHLHLLIQGDAKLQMLEKAKNSANLLNAPIKAMMSEHNPIQVHFAS